MGSETFPGNESVYRCDGMAGGTINGLVWGVHPKADPMTKRVPKLSLSDLRGPSVKLVRKLATIVRPPPSMFPEAPTTYGPDQQERDGNPFYGGHRSIFPEQGAYQISALEVATLVCPPVNAPAPHEEDVLRWPCEGCKLWAENEIRQIVLRRRAEYPRYGVASYAEDHDASRPEEARTAPKKSQSKPRKQSRHGSRSKRGRGR